MLSAAQQLSTSAAAAAAADAAAPVTSVGADSHLTLDTIDTAPNSLWSHNGKQIRHAKWRIYLLRSAGGCYDVIELRHLAASDVMASDRVTLTTTRALAAVWIFVAEFILSGKPSFYRLLRHIYLFIYLFIYLL